MAYAYSRHLETTTLYHKLINLSQIYAKSITTCECTWFLDASLKQFVVVGCSINCRGRHVFYHEVYARKKHSNEAEAMRTLETLNHRFNSVLATESLNQSVQFFYGKHLRTSIAVNFTYLNYFLKLKYLLN